MRSQIVISCLTVAGLLGPMTAGALTTGSSQSGAVPRRVVRFADLNLQSNEGIRRLYIRIKNAAQEVCEPAYFRVAESNVRQRECQERAIEQAVADVRSSSLTALHMASR